MALYLKYICLIEIFKCLNFETESPKSHILSFKPLKRSVGNFHACVYNNQLILEWLILSWLTFYKVLREVFRNDNFRPKLSEISIKRAISTEKDPQKAHLVVSIWK